jgi:hypothetical protein
MKNQTRWVVLSIALTALALLTVITVRAAPSAPSAPLGTGFTYQGKLEDDSGPVSATCDMEFRLYSHATNPTQVGSTIPATVPISDGLFTVELDFGTSAFNGKGRWLGIQVSCPGDSGFTDLGRQELTAVPYALYALETGPHDHWGESWAGTGTGLSLSGGTRGVYGSGSGSGVEGYSSSGYGVFGEGAPGVYGTSDSGYGVHGVGITAGVYGTSDDGYGVHGTSGGSAGVAAHHSSTTGIALSIEQGALQVTGAGEDTDTPVFIHKVRTGAGGNICSAQNYATVIDHPLLNSKPNAILIITPNYGTVSSGTLVRQPYGVYYDDTNQCGFGAGRWVIYGYGVYPDPALELSNNQLFNVMVVLP